MLGSFNIFVSGCVTWQTRGATKRTNAVRNEDSCTTQISKHSAPGSSEKSSETTETEMSCGHGHSHDHGGPTSGRPLNEGASGVEYSLYSKIVMDDVECLNEAEENSGRTVFKSWENRLDKEKVRFTNNQALNTVYLFI